MRKVHYKVVLDIFTFENDDANGVEILEDARFWPEFDPLAEVDFDLDVQDVTIESIEVTDSR